MSVVRGWRSIWILLSVGFEFSSVLGRECDGVVGCVICGGDFVGGNPHMARVSCSLLRSDLCGFCARVGCCSGWVRWIVRWN